MSLPLERLVVDPVVLELGETEESTWDLEAHLHLVLDIDDPSRVCEGHQTKVPLALHICAGFCGTGGVEPFVFFVLFFVCLQNFNTSNTKYI